MAHTTFPASPGVVQPHRSPNGFGGDDSVVDLTALAEAVPPAAKKAPAKKDAPAQTDR